jgi:hypothetical protein
MLDRYFWEYGFRGAERVLSNATIPDVRIISEPDPKKQLHLASLQETANSAWNRGNPLPQAIGKGSPVQIQWVDALVRSKPHRYPYAHDRFVVLDDTVWHFGFSACGSGNCLSAASGPWPAKPARAIEFFEELWESFGPKE